MIGSKFRKSVGPLLNQPVRVDHEIGKFGKRRKNKNEKVCVCRVCVVIKEEEGERETIKTRGRLGDFW